MMRRRWLLTLVMGAFCAAGCKDEAPLKVATEPLKVTVSHPVQREFAPFETLPGRLEAVDVVELRARVSGYLDKVDFHDGARVKEGDLLLEIDPRPYEAALAKAQAEVARWQAQVQRAVADLARAERLRPSGAVTQEELDQAVADRGVAEASLRAAEAELENAQLNLEYTKITAPITGRISRALVTAGNLVTADFTPLTTIVSEDPIRCYFDVDEQTILNIRERIRQGQMQSARERGDVKIWMELADETGFPHEGVIDFVDNHVDPTTGTMRVRGVFANPDGSMSPGFFTRVKVLIGQPAPALLVAERALATELGQKYLWVVNKSNVIEQRPVEIGQRDGTLRVITAGIALDELVVVTGLQRMREGIKVEPKIVPMPEGPIQATPATVETPATEFPAPPQPAPAQQTPPPSTQPAAPPAPLQPVPPQPAPQQPTAPSAPGATP